jgi:transcription elongation GreA/GreB family factor
MLVSRGNADYAGAVSLELKRKLHKHLLERLIAERDALLAAQKEIVAGVTHEDNRAEGDKDMRSTEASYLARGQAMRVQALDEDVTRLAALSLRAFSAGDPVALSALVTLDAGKGKTTVFVAPSGGGMRVTEGSLSIQVVTPASPIGRALLGSRLDDEVEVDRAGQIQLMTVLAIE